jgi:hypothetical protein
MLTTRDPNTFRKTREGHSVFIPALMRSGVFALTRGSEPPAEVHPVPKFDHLGDLTDGAVVAYKGAPLCQFDLRVLLGMMQRIGGRNLEDNTLHFDGNEFLASINRSTGTRSLDALRESLASLRSATFVVKQYARDKGMAFGFVDDVSWDGRRVSVTLSKRAHRAYDALGRCYVPMTVRNQLRDGLQTALADMLYASDTPTIDIKALAALWGREDADEVGREVREAMPKLQAAGVVESWDKSRGRIHVKKARLN